MTRKKYEYDGAHSCMKGGFKRCVLKTHFKRFVRDFDDMSEIAFGDVVGDRDERVNNQFAESYSFEDVSLQSACETANKR